MSWQETTTFTYTERLTVMDPTAGNVCNIQRRILLQLLYEHKHTVKSLCYKNREEVCYVIYSLA